MSKQDDRFLTGSFSKKNCSLSNLLEKLLTGCAPPEADWAALPATRRHFEAKQK